LASPDLVPEGVAASPDAAATGGLSAAVAQLVPALERFARFEEPERAAADRALWAPLLEEALPRDGRGTRAVLDALCDVVVPNGLRVGHPGFSGWVATAPTTTAVAGRLAATVAGPLVVGVQAFNVLEAVGLRWLGELVGLPASYQGLFTSGGSVANLIGLGAARQHAAEREGIDASRDGTAGLASPRIYASEEVHHCIYRAAAVLGLGRRAVVKIPTDPELRMDVPALARRVAADRAAGCTPVAVVATTGTINSGAIDPMPEIAEFCGRERIWLHVDGAYGLFGILDPAVAHLYGDPAAFDSVVVDPHKWLATGMGCGSVFVRDGELLTRAFTLEDAVYAEDSQPIYEADTPLTSQFDDFGYAFHHLGVEHTPPSRGVEVWAVLNEIGAEGMRARVVRHNQLARDLARAAGESPELELLAPVTLSTCCLRYVPESLAGRRSEDVAETLDVLNRQVLGAVRARGRCAPSATFAGGAFAIRACFVNPRTSAEHVDALVADLLECGAEAWDAIRAA
jgi:aromatic-L-amino-acid decarboxylase